MITTRKSPLNASQVLEIRALFGTKSDTDLSKLYGVSRKTIYNIRNNIRWKTLPNPASLNAYPNYTVYPDGRIFSSTAGRFLKPVTRKTGSVVKLTNKTGERRTVDVSKLVTQAFGKNFSL